MTQVSLPLQPLFLTHISADAKVAVLNVQSDVSKQRGFEARVFVESPDFGRTGADWWLKWQCVIMSVTSNCKNVCVQWPMQVGLSFCKDKFVEAEEDVCTASAVFEPRFKGYLIYSVPYLEWEMQEVDAVGIMLAM